MTKDEKATMLDLLGKWAVLTNFYTRCRTKAIVQTDESRAYTKRLSERYNQKVAVMVEIMEALGYNVDMEITPQCEGLVIYNRIAVDGRFVVESK